MAGRESYRYRGLFDVCNPLSGQRLRRTPLCGVAETLYAIDSARQPGRVGGSVHVGAGRLVDGAG